MVCIWFKKTLYTATTKKLPGITDSKQPPASLDVRWWLGRYEREGMGLLVTVDRLYKVVEAGRMLRSHAGYIPRVAVAEIVQFAVLSSWKRPPVDELVSLLLWFGNGNTGSMNSNSKPRQQ